MGRGGISAGRTSLVLAIHEETHAEVALLGGEHRCVTADTKERVVFLRQQPLKVG